MIIVPLFSMLDKLTQREFEGGGIRNIKLLEEKIVSLKEKLKKKKWTVLKI